MVIIRGNTRVADIYLGKYMRLFSHHSFGESLKWRNSDDKPKPSRIDAWWVDSFGNTSRSNRRRFFAGVSHTRNYVTIQPTNSNGCPLMAASSAPIMATPCFLAVAI